MDSNKIIQGDSLEILRGMEQECADLIYMDPPFFTQEKQKLLSKKNVEYAFDDKWGSMDEYLEFMGARLHECKRVLKDTGSIFVHCDRNASHYLKVLLDRIFGIRNFQSEIIWSYKRWSNSKKGLLNNHQVILFYSKSGKFKFHTMYTDYSDTTNIDQILQERVRNENGKTVYKMDGNGDYIVGKSKKGVPLSDVWEIPYLNPKAKERVGYPTQKPLILLEQIIKLVTDEGDLVLDPFVGSGTTAVAAKMLHRKYLGIDRSPDAVELSNMRLDELVRTESRLLKKGRAFYRNLTDKQISILNEFHAVPVQRNSGIDGFLREYIGGKPVAVKIQKEEETLEDAIEKLARSGRTKQCIYMILIRTHTDCGEMVDFSHIPENLQIIDSYEVHFETIMDMLRKMEHTACEKIV